MFISIEGIEGSGKSSLASSLAEEIRSEFGREVVLTREPGATLLGKSIRELLLNRNEIEISSLSELLLFAADRAQHIAEIINPALSSGAVVISDRYYHSTLAYQGYGRGIDLEILHQVNQLATQGLKPNLVLLLDISPEDGLKRASQRGQESWTSFEQEDLDFHQRIRGGFLKLAEIEKGIFAKLDGTKPPEKLLEESLGFVKAKLETCIGHA
jgi:dTMP kinase